MHIAFTWFVVFAALHSLFSWILLKKLWSQVELRTEIFGTVKTLALGPKTLRIRYFLWASAPQTLGEQGAAIRNMYFWAVWTGRVAGVLLLISFALQISAMMALASRK